MNQPPSIAPGPTGIRWDAPDLLDTVVEIFRDYGNVVRLELGGQVWHLLAHPDHVRHVLSTNQDNYFKGDTKKQLRRLLGQGLGTSAGDLWRRQRRALQPLFSLQAVDGYADMVVAATREMAEQWTREMATSAPYEIDVNQYMVELAMDIICRAVFDHRILEQHLVIREAISAVIASIAQAIAGQAVPSTEAIDVDAALQQVDLVIEELLGSAALTETSLLYQMAHAPVTESGEVMSRQQLRDEVLTLFFAGYEAIAQSLSWAWLMLAEHPESESLFHEEVTGLSWGNRPAAQQVPSLRYTRAVIDETLRLRPHSWSFARDVKNDDLIGGYHIPAGSSMRLVPYVTHRLTEFWPDPERFDPERFRPERLREQHSYAYYPLGRGGRMCLGKNFTYMELPLVMAFLGQTFRLSKTARCNAKPMAVYSILRPDSPVIMRVEKR